MPDTVEAEASVGIVTYVDGRREELDISRPLFVLQASKMPADNDTERGFNLFWCAAGRPFESLEAWLTDVKSVDVQDVGPTSGTPIE